MSTRLDEIEERCDVWAARLVRVTRETEGPCALGWAVVIHDADDEEPRMVLYRSTAGEDAETIASALRDWLACLRFADLRALLAIARAAEEVVRESGPVGHGNLAYAVSKPALDALRGALNGESGRTG